MSKPTVALSMIVKDEFEDVMELLKYAPLHFDEINIVVSDKTTAAKFQIEAANIPNLNTKYRAWNDKFDEARNVSMKMCNTDYMFWLDADDSFDFRAIPQLVDIAEENKIDAIFMPYNYMQDEKGNSITRHWRERLIRLDRGYSWRGWVHETLITEQKTVTHKVEFEVKHNATVDDAKNSYERNHKILEKAYAATEDPRYLHYLGMSYFTRKDYEKAAQLLSDYLEVSGSVEDAYRSIGILSECAYHLDKYDLALEYASKCITMKPEYPMGYWLLAQYEADQDNFKEALEWVRVSEMKPDPNTLSVWDPSSRERATLIAARCLFMLHRYNEALAEIRKIPESKEADFVYDDFLKEANAETFISLLPKMRQYFHNDESLFEALCDDMRYDTRLQPLRYKVKKPVTWADNTIVLFCGQSYEEWGPHTVDKGMGGSEEAILYLAPELAKLGYQVHVFGEVPDHSVVDEVFWHPWKEIDMRDKFNVFVSWRAPQYIERVDARVKLVDVHDVLPKDTVKDYDSTMYLVKSQYHSDLLPEDVDRTVIGNGIKKEQFNETS